MDDNHFIEDEEIFLDWNENKKKIYELLISFLFSIIWLLFILLLIYYFIFYLLLINAKIFGLLISLIMLLGIIIDDRFSLIRKILIIIINIVQLLIWMYLDIVSILLLKDIFWFSATLNISFIWHVLILPWSYKLCEYMKWEYMCFIISRLGLLTSVSGALLIIKSLHLLACNIFNYFHGIYKITDCKIIYNLDFLKFIFREISYILEIIYLILNYFAKIFNNYALLLQGKYVKVSLSKILENYKYYIFILIIFIISIIISVPRLYILWISLLVWNWFNYALKSTLNINNNVWPNIKSIKELWRFLIIILKCFCFLRFNVSNDIRQYRIVKYWELIYPLNYILSYRSLFECSFLGYLEFNRYDYWRDYDYFDIIELFIYDEYWKAKLVAKLIWKCAWTSEELDEEVIEGNCERYGFSREEFCKALKPGHLKDKPKFCWYPAENKGITLCQYLFVYRGCYVVGLALINQCVY